MNDAPIYDSAKRPPAAIEELVEAFKYRNLIKEFIRRDIVTRYKRSALGVVWTMLNPLGTMLIMVIVFSALFDTTPKYPIYVLTGLIAWGFFAQTTLAAPQTLLWSGTLIHRVYVPRTVFALVAVGGGLVNMLLSFVPIGVVMLVLRIPPRPPLLFVPVAVLLLAAFTLGVGLLLSSVVAYFPDVLDIYTIFLTAWLYVSAIFYPYEIIPISYRWWFFNLNPMYHLVLLFRDPLYYGNWPSLAHIATATLVSVVALVLGWLAFARKADELGYRI
jgi:ABC-type polysaccharide/polyol phosphate export permease